MGWWYAEVLTPLSLSGYRWGMSDNKPMISDEAVEAVYDKFFHLGLSATQIEGILEAAAPYIAAQAWDEGRESVDFDSCGINPYRSQA